MAAWFREWMCAGGAPGGVFVLSVHTWTFGMP